MFPRLLYFILLPVFSSCHLHYCVDVDIFPDQTGERPYDPAIKIKELSDSYRDGSDGIDVIDIPFV